jgi:chemotaxis protein MotA
MTLSLLDGTSALIVFGGTLLATVLRCGWRESRLALRLLAASFGTGFSAEQARAELVGQVRAIRADGVIRARPQRVGDREIDAATSALIEHRSTDALIAAHRKHRDRRTAEAETAVRVLAQASELAPVFGMAGTLVALNSMPAELATGSAVTGAIGMAVVTTLYGILAANLVLAPLARKVERFAMAEDAARAEVADWLAAQLAEALPHLRAAPAASASTHAAGSAPHRPFDPAEAA